MRPKLVVWQIVGSLLAIIFLAGFFGGFVQVAIICGVFGPMRWANWAPGDVADAVRLPDGRYAILLPNSNRIQIYSPNMQFQYGWFTDQYHFSHLRVSADGNLHYYSYRDRRHPIGWVDQVYDLNGTLLSQNGFIAGPAKSTSTPNLPGRGGQPIAVPDGSPRWWTFPFRGPLNSVGTGLAALLLAIVLSYTFLSPEEREAYRRRRKLPPVDVDDRPGLLCIRWRWFSGVTVVLTLLCVVVILACRRLSVDHSVPIIFRDVIVLFVVLPVAVGLTYSVLCGYFNSTEIVLSGSELVVTRGPLPWAGNRRLPVDHIQQLYSERAFVPATLSQGGVLRSYFIPGILEKNRRWVSRLNARMTDGSVVQLIDVRTPSFAEFLQATLEEKLWALRNAHRAYHD